MVKREFDKKFTLEFLASLPAAPGVYRFYDRLDRLVYVGKAKNLKRRLSQYRNAKRRKAHRKMKKVVAHASRVEIEVCASDLDACLLETRLIQAHRPRLNVVGAYSFLYPMIGLKRDSVTGLTSFCYTTTPEKFTGYEFHGAYRSREITGEAFFALTWLLKFVGHQAMEITNTERRRKYSYIFSYRQLPESCLEAWTEFFKGESTRAMEWLVLSLIENAGARKKKKDVQENIDLLAAFYKHEAQRLAEARRITGYTAYPVPQTERDILFLKRRSASDVIASVKCEPSSKESKKRKSSSKANPSPESIAGL